MKSTIVFYKTNKLAKTAIKASCLERKVKNKLLAKKLCKPKRKIYKNLNKRKFNCTMKLKKTHPQVSEKHVKFNKNQIETIK